MRIAILMANTDDGDFARNYPDDGEKFIALLSLVRPDWEFSVYSVKDSVFPASLDDFDGALITGSPASARDDLPWIARLQDLVREMVDAQKPLFGACFGHQLIAQALGGRVDFNPDGFIVGAIDATWPGAGAAPTFAFHQEQVVELPKSARVISTGPDCPFGGFEVGAHVQTTQYHPELTAQFVGLLLDELEDSIGDGVADRARATLGKQVDARSWAERIARFFEG